MINYGLSQSEPQNSPMPSSAGHVTSDFESKPLRLEYPESESEEDPEEEEEPEAELEVDMINVVQ